MIKFYKVLVPNQYLDKLFYKGQNVLFADKVKSFSVYTYNGFFDGYHKFTAVCEFEHCRFICVLSGASFIGRLSGSSEIYFCDKTYVKDLKRKIKKLLHD